MERASRKSRDLRLPQDFPRDSIAESALIFALLNNVRCFQRRMRLLADFKAISRDVKARHRVSMPGCEIIPSTAPTSAHRSAVSSSSFLDSGKYDLPGKKRERERERANHVFSSQLPRRITRVVRCGWSCDSFALSASPVPPPPSVRFIIVPRCGSQRSEGIKLKQSGDRSNSAPNKISTASRSEINAARKRRLGLRFDKLEIMTRGKGSRVYLG